MTTSTPTLRALALTAEEWEVLELAIWGKFGNTHEVGYAQRINAAVMGIASRIASQQREADAQIADRFLINDLPENPYETAREIADAIRKQITSGGTEAEISQLTRGSATEAESLDRTPDAKGLAPTRTAANEVGFESQTTPPAHASLVQEMETLPSYDISAEIADGSDPEFASKGEPVAIMSLAKNGQYLSRHHVLALLRRSPAPGTRESET